MKKLYEIIMIIPLYRTSTKCAASGKNRIKPKPKWIINEVLVILVLYLLHSVLSVFLIFKPICLRIRSMWKYLNNNPLVRSKCIMVHTYKQTFPFPVLVFQDIICLKYTRNYQWGRVNSIIGYLFKKLSRKFLNYQTPRKIYQF